MECKVVTERIAGYVSTHLKDPSHAFFHQKIMITGYPQKGQLAVMQGLLRLGAYQTQSAKASSSFHSLLMCTLRLGNEGVGHSYQQTKH